MLAEQADTAKSPKSPEASCNLRILLEKWELVCSPKTALT